MAFWKWHRNGWIAAAYVDVAVLPIAGLSWEMASPDFQIVIDGSGTVFMGFLPDLPVIPITVDYSVTVFYISQKSPPAIEIYTFLSADNLVAGGLSFPNGLLSIETGLLLSSIFIGSEREALSELLVVSNPFMLDGSFIVLSDGSSELSGDFEIVVDASDSLLGEIIINFSILEKDPIQETFDLIVDLSEDQSELFGFFFDRNHGA